MTDDYRKELEQRIRLKKQELVAHAKTKPAEKQKPGAADGTDTAESAQVAQLTQRIDELTKHIDKFKTEQIEVSTSVEGLRQVRQSIERAATGLSDLEEKHKEVLAGAGLTFGQIVAVTLDFSDLDAAIRKKEERIAEIEFFLLGPEEVAAMEEDDDAAVQARIEVSLICQKSAIEDEKAELVERMGRPAREYQQYLNELNHWTDREVELRGADQNPENGTLRWLEQELNAVNSVYLKDLRSAREERERISKEVFRKNRALTQFYNSVKQSIDGEIAKCRSHLGEYDIAIEAGLRFSPSFFDEFLKFINQGAVGSFKGQEDGRAVLRRYTDSVDDWEDEDQVFAALDTIVEALHSDRRDDQPDPPPLRDVFKQLKGQRKPQELYDFLFGFEYLEPKYDLKVDGKDLSELSPGERGGLLLIFYLMLDRQDIPLVIDQPEDNLDNKSVYEILVTFIKQAKRRRQIILVTHNPNLAVVADAEQIIHVSIDKKDGKHDFDFFSGAIEDPRINQAVVDILEGTLPAFDNRRLKYRRIDQKRPAGTRNKG